MRHLPTGRQNFAALINEDLIYVDKTRQVYNIIESGRLYFLSRPRRFGKSLLLSTFNYVFSGQKDLFKNLYIGKETDYDFESYPVLHFNFANFGHQVKDLTSALLNEIGRYAKIHNVPLKTQSISQNFTALVQNIAERGKPVVILVDEYDKPIVDFFTEYEKAKANLVILRSFFAPLKDLDLQGHIRFLFVTGVSKFSKVSLFSDLNNLTDLSVDTPLSNDVLGITSEELEFYFDDYINLVADKLNISKPTLLGAIKNWYNGYSFDGKITLHNPFSLLNFFQAQRFGNFWFATGTPTFLVNTIRERGIHPQEFEEIDVDDTFFIKFSLDYIDMTGLLFQTGYLTIKTAEHDISGSYYTLGFPNYEIRKSMMHNLTEAFTYKTTSKASSALILMERGLKNGNVEQFITQLKTILSDIKYNWQPPKPYKTEEELFLMWEGYFHAIIYIITTYMEMSVDAEIATNKGRIDLVAETSKFLYIMEFKLDEPAENAIAQIKSRDYLSKYSNHNKTAYLVGIGFSKEDRNVETWEVEEWKSNFLKEKR